MRITKYWIIAVVCLFGIKTQAQDYKAMMHDPSVNFYDVVKAAEEHFLDKDKGKGSGWKNFERWVSENEGKYYPTGDRSNVSPYYVQNAYRNFVAQNPVINYRSSGNANGWTDLGPYDANNITSHYAPGIGRVEAVWVDPANDQHLYLGSRSGGFWASTDGGASWINSTDTLVAAGVNTIAVSPTFPDSVLINVRNASNGASHGIYRSVNGGGSWKVTEFNPTVLGWGGLGTNNDINIIRIHPTIPDLVFVGTWNGMYRSTDNLVTFTQVLTGDVTDIEFHPNDPEIMYVYDRVNPNKDLVLRSMDRGLTFTQSATLSGNNGRRVYLAASPACPDCVYAASDNGLWRSTDTSANYTFIINPNENCRGFAVSDLDTNIMIYGYVDLEASSNGGAAFNQVTWWSTGNINHDYNKNYVHADLRAMECVNGVFYAGTDGYMCKSSDGGTTWERLSDGTGIRENYRVGVSQNNCYVNMCGSQDNGTSMTNETGWIEWNGGDGMEAIALPLNENWLMGSWQYGGRNRTFDGGQTRQSVGHNGNKDWIAPMAFDPNKQLDIFSFADDVYHTLDWGDNWTTLGSLNFGNIKHAAIAENNSDIMLIVRNDEMGISTDGGNTFTDISSNLPNNNNISDINFDPNNDSTVVICYDRHQDEDKRIYISHDLCNTWNNISYNLSEMPLRSVVIDHSADKYIYAGGEIGVYVMAMGDTVWSLYSTGLPNTSVRELEIQYGSNTLRAATWGRGLWEYTLKDRASYPSIMTTSITDPPTFATPKESVDQNVTSVISYPNTLSDVYLHWSVNTNTLDSLIPMTNSVDSTWVTQWPIPNYPTGTDIFFKVFAVGANNDTTETYRFQYTITPFEPCAAEGSGGTGADYINYVSLNGVDNSSIQDYYGDFTNIYIPLSKNSTYTLRVDLNFAFGPDTARAWIDYNANMAFEESEAIDMSEFSSNQSLGTFTVPDFPGMGDTVLMRVRNVYQADPEPCGTVAGEVEDYSIVIKEPCNSSSSLTETACGIYTSPSGQVFITSQMFTDVIPNDVGCDSLIDIDLTVVNIDRGLIIADNNLTSKENNASYQWLDCNQDHVPIAGAASKTYIATSSGDYAVEVTKSGCKDTSTCANVIISGITDLWKQQIMVYPNPTSGSFFIDLGNTSEEVQIDITNMVGQQIGRYSSNGRSLVEIPLEEPAGVYFINIYTSNNSAVFKLIKED